MPNAFGLELRLQIRDQNNLCEQRIIQRNIAAAFQKEIVEEEMDPIEPLEERSLRDDVHAHHEVREHAADDAPGEGAEALDVAGVGKEEDEENREDRIYRHIGHGAALLLLVDAEIVREAGVPVRDHVDKQVGGESAKKGPERAAGGLSDHRS